MEKPESKEDHIRMMKAFSEKKQEVITWVFVAIRKAGHPVTVEETHSISTVVFGKVPDESAEQMIEQYPTLLNAAGGYQIQTFSSSLVKEMHGSHSGIIGLPMYELSLIIISALKKQLL